MSKNRVTITVSGIAGTGKSLIATSLLRHLKLLGFETMPGTVEVRNDYNTVIPKITARTEIVIDEVTTRR